MLSLRGLLLLGLLLLLPSQAWSDLEGWLFEQIRLNWISADYEGTAALAAHTNN